MEKLQFADLDIRPEIKKALNEMEYNEMTPIQEASLPLILQGKDVIAQAPTGTGKTCCFAVSSVNMVDINNDDVQVLVLCPTRELAIQVTNEIRSTAQYTEGVRTLTIYGGQSIDIQIRGLRKHPQIIVGTPGRVMDHMRRGTLELDHVRLLILDEADEMLDMGFREDLDVILADAHSERQTCLFSATMPQPIVEISQKYQHDAVKVKTTYNELAIPQINQFYVELKEANKEDCLCRMIDTYNFKQALVFCRTKKKVDDLSYSLSSRGYQVEALHGDLKQAGRDKVMEKFRNGIVSVLIATDVAARGLDIEGIDVIFNYDLPEETEYYVHRIGRTARAGRTGSAYSFVTKGEVARIKEYEKYTKTLIERIMPPTLEESEVKKVNHRLDEIKDYIHEKDLSTFVSYIETAIADDQFGLQPIQYAAAMLMQEIKKDSESQDKGLDITEDFSKKARKRETQEGFVRFFVNLGRMDNLERRDLIDMFSQELGINPKDVRNVDVLNTFSFLEIPIEKQQQTIDAFDGQYINDRRIAIEVSDPSNSEGNGNRRKPRTERTPRPEGKRYVRRPREDSEQREFKPRNEEVVREIKHRLNETDGEQQERPARKPRTGSESWERKPRTDEPRGERRFNTGRPNREGFSESRRPERSSEKSRPMTDYSFGGGFKRGRSNSGERPATHGERPAFRGERPAFHGERPVTRGHFGAKKIRTR
jgi:ATP-dependent RNA helicase DeaD